MISIPIHHFCLILMLTTVASTSRAAEPLKPTPDLTQNYKADRELTYNLGPTGLRGWIHTKPANYFESQQGHTTTASRQTTPDTSAATPPSTPARCWSLIPTHSALRTIWP